MRPGTFLPATLATMVSCSLSALADPTELDAWCAQAKQPSSIALCSDPELRELAIERNHAFEAARARLSPEGTCTAAGPKRLGPLLLNRVRDQ